MHTRAAKFVSLLMVVLVPFSMMAAETGAMAFPTGNVSVNGKGLSSPTAIFAGDKIRTDAGSMSLTVAGSTVQVGEKSSVTFSSSQLQLASGGMKVATTNGMAGQVRNLTLTPESGKTVYTVSERDGKVMIAALEGNLALSDGHGQVMLAANHAVAIPVNSQSSDQPTCKAGDTKCEKAMKKCKSDDQNCKAAAAAGGAAAAGAAGAGAGAAAGLSTGAIVGISVGAAAAAVGIGVGVAKSQGGSSSPSK
jgi:hypothetical protein